MPGGGPCNLAYFVVGTCSVDKNEARKTARGTVIRIFCGFGTVQWTNMKREKSGGDHVN